MHLPSTKYTRLKKLRLESKNSVEVDERITLEILNRCFTSLQYLYLNRVNDRIMQKIFEIYAVCYLLLVGTCYIYLCFVLSLMHWCGVKYTDGLIAGKASSTSNWSAALNVLKPSKFLPEVQNSRCSLSSAKHSRWYHWANPPNRHPLKSILHTRTSPCEWIFLYYNVFSIVATKRYFTSIIDFRLQKSFLHLALLLTEYSTLKSLHRVSDVDFLFVAVDEDAPMRNRTRNSIFS